MSRARFSEILANRRRQLGLTIPQAAQVLRLRADVLEAFESGDFANMPTSGYAQGMLSSYARYLGLNATDIVDMFSEELEEYQRRNVTSIQDGREPSSYRREAEGRSYPQGRPYTARTPYDARTRDRRQAAARRNALRRGERSYAESGGYEYDRYDNGSGNISTMRFDEGRYEDDLGFSNNAQPYRAASTPEGRTYRRDSSTTERPNVQRREPSSTHRRVRTTTRSSRGNQRQVGRVARFFEDPVHAFGAVALVVIVVLTVVIIFSVSSCVSNAMGEGSKSVSVSETSTSSDSNSSKSTDAETNEENAREQLAAVDSTSTDTSTDTQTNVTVTVADGAVTWLEVDVDGQSDVADTVTGPWERTYTVTDSITIQAHDTSSVTVTRNGKQVQFDTLAGGVGTVTLKGTSPTADSSDTDSSESDASASTDTSGQSSGTSTSGSTTSASGSSGTGAATSSSGTSGSSGSSASGTAGTRTGSQAGTSGAATSSTSSGGSS